MKLNRNRFFVLELFLLFLHNNLYTEMATKGKGKTRFETKLPKEKSSSNGILKILFWTLLLFVASIIISYLIS